MEDSYIIANFHTVCRLCLHKCKLMVSIFGADPDSDTNAPLTSKLADCVDLQLDPNDGLPTMICYKCLVEVDKCSKFRIQCIRNEIRLRQITSRVNELNNSNSTQLSNNFNYTSQEIKPKTEYIVEDSLVTVVDPSLDYDSSGESIKTEQNEQVPTEQEVTQDAEPAHDNFFKNVFLCQYCDKGFITDEKCKEHEQSYHDPSLPYRCFECSMIFPERLQQIQHAKLVHTNDKPYQCTECVKSFGRRSDLRKHAVVHTGVRPFQCHYCQKGFSRNTNLSKHLRIHTSSKPHVCPLCPRSFVVKAQLDRHVQGHSTNRPFACLKCSLTFTRRDKLRKHELRHETESHHDMVINVNPFSNLMTSNNMNGDSTNMDYELPRVPEHISGESSIMNQQAQRNQPASGKPLQSSLPKPKPVPILNKNKPKNIKCHQCPKKFSSLDAYKTHVSVAHAVFQTSFQCKECFKKFPRKRELDRHSLLHSGMKPFSCTQCDKKFTRKDKLNKHEHTHELDCLVVNMPCIECGATFEKKADLVAHIKSHFSENFDDKGGDDNSLEIKKELVIKEEQDLDNMDYSDQPEYSLHNGGYDMES